MEAEHSARHGRYGERGDVEFNGEERDGELLEGKKAPKLLRKLSRPERTFSQIMSASFIAMSVRLPMHREAFDFR